MINNLQNSSLGLDIYFSFLDLIKASNLVEPYGEIVISGYSDNYTNIVLRLFDGSKREEIKNRLLTHAVAVFNFPHAPEDKIALHKLYTAIDLTCLLEGLQKTETVEELKKISEQYPDEDIEDCWLMLDDETRKRLNSLAYTLFG